MMISTYLASPRLPLAEQRCHAVVDTRSAEVSRGGVIGRSHVLWIVDVSAEILRLCYNAATDELFHPAAPLTITIQPPTPANYRTAKILAGMHNSARSDYWHDRLDSLLHLDSITLAILLKGTISSVGILALSTTGLPKDVVAILVLSIIHSDEWIIQTLVVSLLAHARRDTFGNTATDGFLTLG